MNLDIIKCTFRLLLCRVFTAICSIEKHRGLVIQQGGAKVLIPLALDNTDAGKLKAAQALSKIAITNDPKIAFPGQRVSYDMCPFYYIGLYYILVSNVNAEFVIAMYFLKMNCPTKLHNIFFNFPTL